MSHKEFGPNDIFINRVKMHPEWDFFIYNSEVYINNSQNISGSNSGNYKGVPEGFLSLYEYNLDRTTDFVRPFLVANSTYKTRFRKDLNNLTGEPNSTSLPWSQVLANGEVESTYRMSASITRQYLEPDASTLTGLNHTSSVVRNICRQYRTINSDFSDTPVSSSTTSQLHKLFLDDINMVNIPSIFYGSEMKKGTIDLNYYLTGTLIASAKDENQNGKLISTFGTTSGSVIGYVLYREGILFFPKALTAATTALDSGNSVTYNQSVSSNAKWIYFGGGANDSFAHHATHASASYSVNFEGTTYKNTMTMFCHADKGELNYSNNPSHLNIEHSGSIVGFNTSDYTYSDHEVGIKNIASSSFYKGEDDFRKVTYPSKVGVYDEDNNLLMTVDLARPYKKEEKDNFTFKIKYDLL
jgi:hypothetical protein